MNSIILKAPAKINLGLNIVKKREDGFHNIETFFYPIKPLCDELTITKTNSFVFSSNNKLLQQEKNNLITSAHNLLKMVTKKELNVKFYLDKKIPIGAGLGGGSSNAASTLVGLNKLFKLNISSNNLNKLALTLGSDVPFFIKEQAAVGKYRGEVLEYTNLKINKPILIVNPGIHISTKEAFKNIKIQKSKFDYNYFLKTSVINFNFLKENLTNDFEDFVFDKYPDIKDIKNNMYINKAVYSSMSGTGSTVYGIFDSKKDAQFCLSLFPNSYLKIII